MTTSTMYEGGRDSAFGHILHLRMTFIILAASNAQDGSPFKMVVFFVAMAKASRSLKGLNTISAYNLVGN